MQGGSQFLPSSTADPHAADTHLDEWRPPAETAKPRRRHARRKSHRPLGWLHLGHQRPHR